jgi:hypothetical protein
MAGMMEGPSSLLDKVRVEAGLAEEFPELRIQQGALFIDLLANDLGYRWGNNIDIAEILTPFSLRSQPYQRRKANWQDSSLLLIVTRRNVLK